MSFNALLDHSCDIYHISAEDKSPGWGLAASKTFSYPQAPDLSDVPCHFAVRASAGSQGLHQLEPQNELSGRRKLDLPAGTDIRINDKVIHREGGLEYTAEEPMNIRGHHMTVYVYRTDDQKPLGE
ncbi:MAG: YqbH/XkdH family protein [Oscillospiraceae bacterium]|jgi:hypothetical protein|nr:YqbH/XkdH family protein [Oscillospiraceae bacterium]